jgi:heavy metal sensor kinase
MKDLSIRLRLTMWYSAVLLAALAVFGFGMWFALEHRLMAGVDTRLAQRIQGARNALGAEAEVHNRRQLQRELSEFAAEIPDGAPIQLWDRSGAAMLPNPKQIALPREAAAGPGMPRTMELSGKPFRIVTGRLDSAGETFDLLVAAPLDEALAVMRDFRNLLFLLIPAVLALACAGGYLLSVRALRPVDEITAVAKSIGLRNLSRRIAVPRTGDELQRMSETWNEVLERLDAAVQRIRRFTADASHELRTPLTLIRATAELALRREREPEEYRRSLMEIESQAEQMTTLTESLLTIARADFEGFDMPLAATDLNEAVIAEVLQNQARAAEKGVRLTAVTEGRQAVANANGPGIRRLLRILIDNAVKHTPQGGAITVSAVLGDGGAALLVEDTGEGIAPADLPFIFERFYRADRVRGGGSGFGLGLSIAQAIAQAHGSRITVESSPGAGARFRLALKA